MLGIILRCFSSEGLTVRHKCWSGRMTCKVMKAMRRSHRVCRPSSSPSVQPWPPRNGVSAGRLSEK